MAVENGRTFMLVEKAPPKMHAFSHHHINDGYITDSASIIPGSINLVRNQIQMGVGRMRIFHAQETRNN